MNKSAVGETSSPWRVHGIGGFVLAALFIGGATDKWATSDLILHILAVPLILAALWSFPNRQLGRLANGFAVAIIAIVIAQLIPAMGLGKGLFLVTIDGGHTLDSFVFIVVTLSVFYVTASLQANERSVILRYILIGVAINFVLAFVQFAAAMPPLGVGTLPYPLRAGFFENKNHLSALLYMAAPLVVATARKAGLSWVAIVSITVMIAFQFVVRSRAGVMLILVGVGILGVGLLRQIWIKVLCAITAVAAVAGAVWLYAPEFSTQTATSLGRPAFTVATWKAVLDYLPWGSGFGTFQLVYPSYEAADQIIESYVNHAHNDWLEALLEGGLLAGAAMVGYVALLLWRSLTGGLDSLQKAALIAIALVLLHSLVDYPLRTLAIATLFAVLNAIVFSPPAETKRRVRHRHRRS